MDLETMLLRDGNPNLFVKSRQQDNLANLLNLFAGQQNQQRASDLRAQVPAQQARADSVRAAQAAGYGEQNGAAQYGSLMEMMGAQGDLPMKTQQDQNALGNRQLDNERYNINRDAEVKGKLSDDNLLGQIIAAVSGGSGYGAGLGMGGGGGGGNEMLSGLINSRYPGMVKPGVAPKGEGDLAALVSQAEQEKQTQSGPSDDNAWMYGNPSAVTGGMPLTDILATMFGGGSYNKWDPNAGGAQLGPAQTPPAQQVPITQGPTPGAMIPQQYPPDSIEALIQGGLNNTAEMFKRGEQRSSDILSNDTFYPGPDGKPIMIKDANGRPVVLTKAMAAKYPHLLQ